MIKGFSLLEVIVALSLSVLILTVVLTNVAEATYYSKKITTTQQKMESIFHTVDTIKSDLCKCGMRLQNASLSFGFPMFEHSDTSFRVLYGVDSENMLSNSQKGAFQITINKSDYFVKNKKILIYDSRQDTYEFNMIKTTTGGGLGLTYDLQNDYPKNAMVVSLKEVEYAFDKKQKELKRKVNSGYFQPLMENVTDFFVRFYPDSHAVYYRIEVNQKEQVRGYIYLANTVNQ